MAGRIIAVLILAGLGFCVYSTKQQANIPMPGPEKDKPRGYENADAVGVKPEGEPEFHVDVELRLIGPRNVLEFTITEAHGWYADFVYVEFWYGEKDEDGEWNQVGDPVVYMCHHFLDYGATLVENTTLMDIEFPELDGEFGTTENWQARVNDWRRVLAPEQ